MRSVSEEASVDPSIYTFDAPSEVKDRMARLGYKNAAELAQEANIPKMTLSDILSGRREPGLFRAQRLASALRMPLEFLAETLAVYYVEKAGQSGTRNRTLKSSATIDELKAVS